MRLLTAALAISVASPVVAQDRMTQDQCVQSFAGIQAMFAPEIDTPDIEVNDAGWCRVEGLEFSVEARTRTRLSSLQWRASDMARFIEQGLPPRALEVEGRGLHVVAQVGDEIYNYLLGLQMQQAQLDFGATVRWDGVQNTLSLTAAYIDFNDTNRIEGTARIEGVDLTDIASMQTSLGTAGLRNLTLKSQFDGWFESYAAIPMGGALLTTDGGSPQSQVAALQRQAIDMIDEFPETLIPENNRTALAAFITSLPTPRGTAQFQLNADPIIGAVWATRFASIPVDPKRVDALVAGLDGVSAVFTWNQAEGE